MDMKPTDVTKKMMQCFKHTEMFPEGSSCPWCEEKKTTVNPWPVPWFMIEGWVSRLDAMSPTSSEMEDVAMWYRKHGYPECRFVSVSHDPWRTATIAGKLVQVRGFVRFDTDPIPSLMFSTAIQRIINSSTAFDLNAYTSAHRSALDELLLRFPPKKMTQGERA